MKEILKSVVVKILYKLSDAVLKKYQPKIIGITGTVGKTSTKEAIYATLSKFESVRKSPKSFNSEFGIPLTILGAKNPGQDIFGWFKVMVEGMILLILTGDYPHWLVLEVGTDRPGDIKAVTKWLHPDIVVVTKLSKIPVHVEAFGTPENLFNEKGNLVRALKTSGTLILNGDDEDVMKYKELWSGDTVTFSKPRNSEIIYDENGLPSGIKFGDITLEGTLGDQHAEHIEAALAVIKVLGFNIEVAKKSFENQIPTAGRMRLVDGVNGSLIIDDTYNSSPIALKEALKTLKNIKLSNKDAKKVAILGDMLELGKFTTEAHKEGGVEAKKVVDVLATVGVRSKLMEGADYNFDDSVTAGKEIKKLINKGDIILVKGSQGVRMEKAVVELMAHPEMKEKLLVRMDKEWKGR